MKHSDTNWTINQIIETFFENDINPACWLGTQICDAACANARVNVAEYEAAVLSPCADTWILLTSTTVRVLPVEAMSADRSFVRVIEMLEARRKDYSAVIDTRNILTRTGPKTAFVDSKVIPVIGSTKEIECALLSLGKVHKACRHWHERHPEDVKRFR